MSKQATIETRAYGTDLVLDEDVNRGRANGGKYASVTGRNNALMAVHLVLQTTPGELVHRPEYGAGLTEFVGTLNSPAQRARLAVTAQRALVADPRIRSAAVAAGEGDTPSQTVVEARIALTTEDEPLEVTTVLS